MNFKQEIPAVFAKTSIALAVIVAICSGAIAAEKRQPGTWGYYGSSQPGGCAHGTRDPSGLRCDVGN
jgi:hypothetical protein